MAQHIAVVKVDEQGNKTSQSNANFAAVNYALTSQADWKETYPWISTIEEYGNTIFNHLQVPHVKQELLKLRSVIDDPEALQEIDAILRCIGKGNGIDTYLKFIGD